MINPIRIGYLVAFLALFSCSNDTFDELTPSKKETKEAEAPKTKMSEKQAMMYANMLANIDDGEVSTTTSRSIATDRSISDIQYYVQEGDTVIYLFNYTNNQGFIMLGADNSTYPIIAQAKEGRLDLDNIDENSYLKFFIESNAHRIKKAIYNPDSANSAYYEDWADLGKDGYEYVIDIADDEPSEPISRGSRRKSSSGKTSIYPYTGKDLDFWCQEGGYNMSAPNFAKIGCPAIAIGMLMYDTSERANGNLTRTTPSFSHTDMSDIKDVKTANSLSERLRQIADSIPYYNWGGTKDATSGADAYNIQTGLRKLGFTKATLTDYNFETLYAQLTFKGINYFGNEQDYTRGILLGASHTTAPVGHIWFCDGYYEQSFKVTKKFMGIKVESWTEYDDRLYMNWGWGNNKGNGWYAANEAVWTNLDGESVDYKKQPKMYINLSYYARPQ